MVISLNDKQLKQENIQDLPKEYDKVIEVKIDAESFDPSLCQYDADTEVDDKMIGYLERQIRGSYEYRNYINYLKNELDLNKCELMPGLDLNVDPVSLEFHHYPITLYEITAIVATDLLNKCTSGSVSSFEIAEQVMKEHYENNVGLVPLTATLHEMAHSKSLIIPMNTINGNFSAFIEKYKDSIPPEIKDKIDENIIISSDQELIDANKFKLEKKIMNYDIKYDTDKSSSTESVDIQDIDDLFDDDEEQK